VRAVAAERVLTERELNRAVLHRQLLLERSNAPLPKALERIGGIQAQYAPSMYIGLWSRLGGFERETLTRALERRSVVQATLMRATIHLVSAGDYWPFEIAIARARREGWLAYGPRATETSAREMAGLARKVRSRMRGGTMSRAEIQEITGNSMRTNGVGMWIDLVRAPPSGTWERRRADLYALAEEWLGPPEVERKAALRRLIRAYLQGFGPAARTEIADWAGLPVSIVSRTLAGMDLRRFRTEAGGELVDLPRLPLPDSGTPAPPRFIPTWDASLLVHCRRAQILPEEFRPRVFSTKTPQSVPTFLVDGQVAGTWRYDGGRVRLEPFRKLTVTERRALDREAERLAAFHA
jgi:Winged helix DNA-binding domain